MPNKALHWPGIPLRPILASESQRKKEGGKGAYFFIPCLSPVRKG